MAVFFVYSKAYEHRKVSLKQLGHLTDNKYSKQRIIEAEAMVLGRLAYQVFAGVVDSRQSTEEVERAIREFGEEPLFAS